MGQFFTPDPVVDFMIQAVSPLVGERILDPFCGSGHFLSKAISCAKEQSGASENDVRDWVRLKVHGIEKSERMVRIARTDQLLHGDFDVSIHRQDSLVPFSNFATLQPGAFDVVLTNPPFGSLLGIDSLHNVGPFELARPSGTTPVDVLGLERSVQFLRAGGRLAIVLPEGVFSNLRLGHVRTWIRERLSIVAVVSLPACTFSPFGANVRTSVLFAIKRGPDQSGAEIDSVLVAGADCIGYDSSGKTLPAGNELPEISILVRRAFAARTGARNVA
jgi:type I restriction enzyme M protein